MKRIFNKALNKAGVVGESCQDYLTKAGMKPIDFHIRYDDGSTGTICILSPWIVKEK